MFAEKIFPEMFISMIGKITFALTNICGSCYLYKQVISTIADTTEIIEEPL